mgnify:CR=1 FL=1
MENNNIKLSFSKVKQDIQTLENTISGIKSEISEIRELINSLYDSLIELKYAPPLNSNTPTLQHSIPTLDRYPTDTPTLPQEVRGLITPNLTISTGNEGVPTDRQTDRQTDKYTQKQEKIKENSIENAVEILESLDNIRKEIRLKFKRLTEQEILVFSNIYQLEEEQGYSDYKTLSQRLKLTESSVRDYVRRLIDKGIPVDKTRINNKTIRLSISPQLKKIASLSTILKLRGL